jgi:hypothetical protein
LFAPFWNEFPLPEQVFAIPRNAPNRPSDALDPHYGGITPKKDLRALQKISYLDVFIENISKK